MYYARKYGTHKDVHKGIRSRLLMEIMDSVRSMDNTLQAGITCLQSHIRTLPTLPGVYRMLDARGAVLYVGKAKNLRNRVRSYTQTPRLTSRLVQMVSRVRTLEYTVTRSEAEALLLEANLIKSLKPRYNILLRDDKSFPYLLITGDHEFPQIRKHRGAHKAKGTYFGPFASVSALNQTLTLLQKAFLLRPCSDHVFAHRTRPCLQYQIKRCSAPCVRHIDAQDYQQLVHQATAFLRGKSRSIQESLTQTMQALSAQERYEEAAVLRDRIRALTQVQSEQGLHIDNLQDADAFALVQQGGHSCVQLMTFRGGQHYGVRHFFPKHAAETAPSAILAAFLGQYYQRHEPPALLLVNHMPEDKDWLEDALSLRLSRQVCIACPQRGKKRALMEQIAANATIALQHKLRTRSHHQRMREDMVALFDLPKVPERIEIYDNSHIRGSHAVGAMVVSTPEGLDSSAYRVFTIKRVDITPGDDYGMLREVLTRRLKRMQQEPDAPRPDLLLIDGGAGQLSVTQEVLVTLGVSEVPYVAIAKGPERNAGRETFHLPDRAPFTLPPHTPVLHYLQQLRDEAHRFAISSYRKKHHRSLKRSALDAIPGVGPGRKKALFLHFGSAEGVTGASIDDLCQVPGIHRALAQQIYDHLHGTVEGA